MAVGMAAAAAACRRALLLARCNPSSNRAVAGLASGLGAALVARSSSACSFSPIGGLGCYQGRIGHLRHASQLLLKSNGKRAFLVDTLALVRSLEAQGIPSKHAEAITSAITEGINDSLENVAQSLVSQGELQKEHHFPMLQRETEKLRSDIEKLRSEMRYEIDKIPVALEAQLEAIKYDVIKYCIGSLVSITAVGLAVVCILL